MTSRMRVLVLGQGGREHAIVKALRLSPSVNEVHAIPGSSGMGLDCLCHEISLTDQAALRSFLQRTQIDLVVIGPEVYLAQGLADQIRSWGFAVVGPSRDAAQLEASKVFAKEFMLKAAVPTARFHVVTNVDECMRAAVSFKPPFVLKADGLAAGKGVFICASVEELQQAASDLFERKTLGDAGVKALLEQFHEGWELSYLVLTNGREYQTLPLAQDHKRLMDGGVGPNTGGMGVVAPLTIDAQLSETIRSTIIAPVIEQIHASGMLYRGVLYFGLMMTAIGPMVLEFNVRFGDPEAQVICPLLDGDWGLVFRDLAQGTLSALRWKPLHTACVVLAAQGYPDQPVKGAEIAGDILWHSPSSYFLHAGTTRDLAGVWRTGGGRVLNALGIGNSLREALRHAYAQADHVRWPGRQMRTDIGAQQVSR